MLKLVTLQMDRFDETIEYCKRIVESPIASKEFKAVSYSDTALALAYKNKIKEGMSCIKEAIKLLPEEPDFYAVKGFLYLKLNDELNAEKSFNKAEVLLKKQKDKEMSCLSLIGSYCFDSQYYDGAIYYFQTILLFQFIKRGYRFAKSICYQFSFLTLQQFRYLIKRRKSGLSDVATPLRYRHRSHSQLFSKPNTSLVFLN